MQSYGQKTTLVTPQDFFKNRALSLLYPYIVLTSCKKLEKTNRQSLRYLEPEQRTDQGRAGVKIDLKLNVEFNAFIHWP